MNVKVNAYVTAINVINSSMLFVDVGDKRNQTMIITIANIINYIDTRGFTVSTIKKKTASSSTTSSSNSINGLASTIVSFNPSDYGIADQIILQAASNSFVPYNPTTRIVFTDNYASSGTKTIIAVNDYILPSQLPTSTLRYSFTSNVGGCSSEFSYNKTITLRCALTVSGNVDFSIYMYDTKLPGSRLSSFSKSIYLYPAPNPHCTNALCDVCSSNLDGSEHCFVCREGLFSNQG